MKKILARIILFVIWSLLIILASAVGLVALGLIVLWGCIIYESDLARAYILVDVIAIALVIAFIYLMVVLAKWAEANK